MLEHPATLLCLGIFVGFLGSLVGIGGGFLMVPFFRLLLGLSPQDAVGTSLGVIAANASSGAIGFARQKRIDFLVGTVLGLSTIPGTFLGKFVNQRMANPTFDLIFAGMVAVAAILTAFFRAENRSCLGWFRRGVHRRFDSLSGEVYDYTVNLWSAGAFSVALGFIAALFGVGGGFVHVPLLILLYGVPAHVAMATSHFVLVMTTGVSAVEYAVAGEVRAVPFLAMGLGAIVGAQAGVRLSARLSGRFLRAVLAVVLLAIAVSMVIGGLRKQA